MQSRRWILAGWSIAALALTGCGRIGYSLGLTESERDAAISVDAALDARLDAALGEDAGVDAEIVFVDAAMLDAASVDDAGAEDAGPGDAGPGDAGPDDAGPGDAGPGDAGPDDAGAPEPVTLTFCDRAPSCRTGTVSDTYVSEEGPTANFGSWEFVSFERSPSRVGLIRFDLRDVPRGANVTRAELRLVTTDNYLGAGDVTLHVVRDSWSELQATFERRAASTPWTARGVGVGSRDAASIGMITPTRAWTEHVVVLPTAVVQAWVDDPDTNYGFALVAALSSGTDSAHFASHESAMVSARPMLSVTYLP